MIVLSYLVSVHVRGQDAGQFLHNQLSADVLALSPGQSTFACYCEPKGRVLALLLVSRKGDDGYNVIMSRSLASAITQRLRIYVMRDKVKIEILDDFTVYGLYSDPGIPSRTSQTTLVPLPSANEFFLVSNEAYPSQANADTENAWRQAELKRGITWLSPATSGQFLPQWLGFEQLGAVNFRKGCYPGQEIVARTHYLGKVKRHPRVLCTRKSIHPDPMDKINILSEEEPNEAVVIEVVNYPESEACLFVVTRMDPESDAEMIEYEGQSRTLV